MFKVSIAVACVAAEATAATTTTPKVTVDKVAVGNEADQLAKFANDAARIESQAAKEAWDNFIKHGKLSSLEGQYNDYRFFKAFAHKTADELKYFGPNDTCDVTAFTKCVAQESQKRCRDPGHCHLEDYDFNYASQKYRNCTTSSKCDTHHASATPAEQQKHNTHLQENWKRMRTMERNMVHRQEKIWSHWESGHHGIEEKYTKMHMANVQHHANPFFKQFKCSGDCMMKNTMENHGDMERAWHLCKCESPAHVQYSPKEVLELVESFKFDRYAGIDEAAEELAAQAPKAEESNNGWIAFAALASANAAYLGYKKMY